jgi:2-(3-amino-3-carboxypropyl)histidine synthase
MYSTFHWQLKKLMASESTGVVPNEKSFDSYDFQLDRIIEKAKKLRSEHIGLQFPEGFLEYATRISRQLAEECDCDVTIMADAVFGACCVDDLACRSQGIDLLVHFGHSCLVPVDQTVVQTMYIPVTMKFNQDHLLDTIKYNFPPSTKIALQGTVQFSFALFTLQTKLQEAGYTVQIPRCKPLSPGETLGCTSPQITGADILVFVADGRFHVEAAMMANPELPTFRYDPFTNRLFQEFLSMNELKQTRMVQMKKALSGKTNRVGLILGTLGRQGSVGVLESLRDLLNDRGIEHFTVLISEISPDKLKQFGDACVDAWIQVACPRLSIDWGESYSVPLLSSYEAFKIWSSQDDLGTDFEIPMDYYSNDAGPWGNYAPRQGGWAGSTEWKFWHMGPGKRALKPVVSTKH